MDNVSKSGLQEYLKSPLKASFDVILEQRIGHINQDFANGVESIEELRRLQGELAGVKFWQLLPELVLKEMERDELALREKKEIQNDQ